MRSMKTLFLAMLCIAGFALIFATHLRAAAPPTQHTTTDWQLKPSLKYDSLCLLNVLSGDPYYMTYYKAQYDHFRPLFTPDEISAFEQLKRVMKDEAGGIISAQLTLYFSLVSDETLPEMIRTAQDSSAMEAALKKTSYWDESDWKSFQKARPALVTALLALNRVGFSEYWAQNAKPRIEKRISELSPELPKYNIVPVIEGHLGFPLPSDTITVYLLAYSEPHGIRITGLRFLTHESYPFKIVLHNAIHESMHPPYDLKDPTVAEAVRRLGEDPLVVDKVKHHDTSFGYNGASEYIDEDSVQALEEIVSEQFGVGRDAQGYWKEQDGGMHVLAVALYTGYKQALARGNSTYSQWLIHAVSSGELLGDNLEKTINAFFATTPQPAPK
jgi:hypothetical protein